MTAVDWDEVKRLAADFQRAQLSSTVQRLSERNCIELISKLIEQKLLDVVFTTDGKEYVTPQQLTKEIQDELYIHGGRINLVELAKILNVDFNQISARVSEIERSDSNCMLVLGQLIDKSYIQKIAHEIDEKLSQQGQISVGDLTQQYDLPSDFLQSLVQRNLGKIIHAKQDKTDPRVFYTDNFVARNRACLRGALMASTCPTSVAQLLSQSGVQERLFHSLIDSLTEMKQIPGVITGKQSTSSMYIPAIYSKSQSDWVNNFYKQNGYLEYDALTRLGINDPQSFVSKHFPKEKLLHLKSCAVGPQLVSQVESVIEEALITGSFIDVMPHLPSVFESDDGEAVLRDVLKILEKKHPTQKFHIFCSTFVVSEKFLHSLNKPFEIMIQKKAEKSVSSGAYLYAQAESKLQMNKGSVDHEEGHVKGDKKEERRKKATGGKAGGGTVGRETKTKSTKKKYLRGKVAVDDSDDDMSVPSTNKGAKHSGHGKLELLQIQEIQKILEENETLQDDDYSELIEELSQYLHPLLNKTALSVAQTVFESTIASTAQTRRKNHSELQEKLNSLISDIRMFEKGIKQFPNNDVQQQLVKYLLKSVCTDVANDIFLFVAQENMMQLDQTKELTPELRLKIINDDHTNDIKDPLSKLNKSLNSSIEDFLSCVEVAMGSGICDMVLKKPDKKKERIQVYAHRQALLEQLESAKDPAVVLHVTSLVLFQTVTQTMLHASGRFVSNILLFLQPHLSADMYNTLQRYHDLVLKLLTTDKKDSVYSDVITSLEDGMPSIKEIALTYKKPPSEKTQSNAE